LAVEAVPPGELQGLPGFVAAGGGAGGYEATILLKTGRTHQIRAQLVRSPLAAARRRLRAVAAAPPQPSRIARL
jgi:hypothetical protein